MSMSSSVLMKPCSGTTMTRYYTIRVSRTVAHVTCLCFIIGFCFLLIALPSLDKSRQTGSITDDFRAGARHQEEDDEPMVVVEYDPAEAARKREDDRLRLKAQEAAKSKRNSVKSEERDRSYDSRDRSRELEKERLRESERERLRDRDRELLRERERAREALGHEDSRRPELPPRVEEERAPARVAEAPDREASEPVRIKLPNGMKGCTRPSVYGRGYFVDLDQYGQLNSACKMDRDQVTRNVRNTTTKSLCTVEELNHISLLNSEQRRTLDAQVLVDDAHKFMFCFVPKVACSNWKRVIKYMNGKVPDLETPMKMDHHKDLVFLSDFTQDEVEYRLKNYFKFMFVRDPTERLLSAYRNKFGENIGTYNSKYGPKIIEKYRKPGFRIEGEDQSRITFEEFLRFTVDSDTRKMDPHWRPMHELCQPCAINYDFIGSFEQLSEDASLVLDRIRGDSDAYFPKRQRWYKPTTDDRLSKELKHVHTEYLKRVVDKYARDYMLFGYPPPVSEVTRPKWS